MHVCGGAATSRHRFYLCDSLPIPAESGGGGDSGGRGRSGGRADHASDAAAVKDMPWWNRMYGVDDPLRARMHEELKHKLHARAVARCKQTGILPPDRSATAAAVPAKKARKVRRQRQQPREQYIELQPVGPPDRHGRACSVRVVSTGAVHPYCSALDVAELMYPFYVAQGRAAFDEVALKAAAEVQQAPLVRDGTPRSPKACLG